MDTRHVVNEPLTAERINSTEFPRYNNDLVDRNCVFLDGACKCPNPWNDCKYLSSEKDQKQIRDKNTQATTKES